MHPKLIKFSWFQVDDESRILEDLEIKCWDSSHTKHSIIFAIPSILVWGFGIPIFAQVVLYKHRAEIDDIEIREKYGFLCNGYKKKYYYWESVNMYRKIIIILISVFLKLFGVITQALVIFLVIIVFLILNMKLLPFKFKSLNDLEILSLMTWMVTIYCGLFYLSDIPEVYNSEDESVKEADNGRK